MNLSTAIIHWSDLADRKTAFSQAIAPFNPSLAREAAGEAMEARGVVSALRMEQSTGIPHCSCKNPPHPVTR